MPLTPAEVYLAAAGTPAFQVIDVRSPVEVARGALRYARALPLMSDEERHRVGIRYQQAGQQAAIALGYELAGPHLAARSAAWRAAAAEAPSVISCWRGGLRSAIAAEHLGDARVTTVVGGYKALRAHLLQGLATLLNSRSLWVLGGLTGSGKTEVLQTLASHRSPLVIDLEGLAQHRGSAFGAEEQPQPTQATFENALALSVWLAAQPGPLVVEDESRFVGQRELPENLWVAMCAAPLVWLEAPLAERVTRVVMGYVIAPAQRHGVTAAHQRLAADLQRIRRRLGGVLLEQVNGQLEAARREWFNPAVHQPWVTTLLRDYYDRLYLHGLMRSGRVVRFRGEAEAMLAFLQRAS